MSISRTLIERVLELAKTSPDSTALAFRKEKLTYGELAEMAQAAAAYMAGLGVKRGDRVLYTAVSKPQTFVFYLAAQYLGAMAVPTDKVGTPEHELDLYRNAGAVLLLTTLKYTEHPKDAQILTQKDFLAECHKRLEAAAEGGAPVGAGIPYEYPGDEAISEILFTSGTTGRPKGVMLSYRAVLAILKNTKNGLQITADDVVLMPLPLHHSLALRVSRAVLYAGATLVLQNGFAFAKETENNLSSFGCTGFAAVPVSMELLRSQMQEQFYEIMGRFRFIEIGAGALTVEQRKRLSERLPNTRLTNTWGSSETGGVLFAVVHDVAGSEQRVSTLGKPVEGAKLEVLGDVYEDGVKPGADRDHPGRLALYGPMVMSGYYEMPEQTADALRDGWLVTNDLVYLDADGYVFMLGRSDDIINIGGEKLSPLEVENIASEYEGAGEYACIGIPDPEGLLGQVPVLYVGQCRSDYSAEELRKYLASRMERIKLPTRIIELDKLPRNRMEKLDRRAIAALAAQIS